MASSELLNTGSIQVLQQTQYFYPVVGSLASDISVGEGAVEVPVRFAGKCRNLFVYVRVSDTSFATVIALRKSQTTTSLDVSYSAAQTGIKEDRTAQISMVATDEIAMIVSHNASETGSITIRVNGIEFAPTVASTCVMICCSRGQINFTAEQTSYNTINGVMSELSNEAIVKFPFGDAYTASNLYVYVSENGGTGNCTFGTRKNGSNGNQSVLYTSGQTGAKEDTSNTDSLVSGNDFNFYTIGAASVSVSAQIQSCTLRQVGTFFPMVSSDPSTVNSNVAFGSTVYFGGAGNLFQENIEISTQFLARFNWTAKQFGAYVTANDIGTSASTVTFRDNGADSAMVLSYAAGQTGLKTDAVNTAVITKGTDEVNYAVTTPDTSGTISFSWIGLMSLKVELAGPANFFPFFN